MNWFAFGFEEVGMVAILTCIFAATTGLVRAQVVDPATNQQVMDTMSGLERRKKNGGFSSGSVFYTHNIFKILAGLENKLFLTVLS